MVLSGFLQGQGALVIWLSLMVEQIVKTFPFSTFFFCVFCALTSLDEKLYTSCLFMVGMKMFHGPMARIFCSYAIYLDLDVLVYFVVDLSFRLLTSKLN